MPQKSTHYWYKHERGWENSRQLCKPEMRIIVENSMQTPEKSFLLLFYKITFPKKKNAKFFVMTLIKREILTSRQILYTKYCTRNQFLVCKKMLSKIRIFLAYNVSLSEKKLTQLVWKDFPSFSRRRNELIK